MVVKVGWLFVYVEIFWFDLFNEVVFVGWDVGDGYWFYVNEDKDLMKGWKVCDEVGENGRYFSDKFGVD